MITNGKVNINGNVYKAHIFAQNTIKAGEMGEELDCSVTVRVPIERNRTINVSLGDYAVVGGEKIKIVKITVNRTGCNPHYHFVGVM